MITLNHVTKKFKIPHRKEETVFSFVKNIFHSVTYETIRAVDNVNFEIHGGEIIGIIGNNGSGKTTLLQIISGILPADEGSIDVQGDVAPFLGLGVGFHGDLTAQENVYLYGAILGLTRKYLHTRMKKILKYAGVEKFKDTQLKKFSSGMQARLAFAMMIETQPDILILDEIFAVGDKDFQPKCFEVFKKYKESGKTILFATHDMSIIKKHCTKVLLLNKGKQLAYGKPEEVLKAYESVTQ